MTNVFFRCVLGRTSLMILLFPNIALSCKDKNLNMAEVMRDFRNIIFYDFEHLFTCLDSKGYNSSGRNPQKSKHSLCLNGMEVNSVHHLTCSIVYITKQVNFEFAQEIMALSKKTESALKCRCRNQKRHRTKNRKSKTSTRSKTKASQKQLLYKWNLKTLTCINVGFFGWKIQRADKLTGRICSRVGMDRVGRKACFHAISLN